MPEGVSFRVSAPVESGLQQDQVVSLVLKDEAYDYKLVRPAYFTDPVKADIVLLATMFRDEFHEIPTQDTLQDLLLGYYQPDEETAEYPTQRLEEALQVLQAIPELPAQNVALWRSRSKQFLKTRRIEQALLQKDRFLASGEHERFAHIMLEAATVGDDSDVPVLSLWDTQTWYDAAVRTIENAIPSGFPTLDQRIIGYAPGELITVVAPPSGGKTRFLLSAAVAAMRAGKDALFLSVEMESWKLCVRVGMRLLGRSKDIMLADPDSLHTRMSDMRATYDGHDISFARFDPGRSTLGSLKSFYRTYLETHEKPGIVIVDYADKLAPERSRDALRHELHDIYLGLFSWAVDEQIPVMTASQTNREGMDRPVVAMKQTAEAISKVAISDIVVTLATDQQNPFTSVLFLAKNRDGAANARAILTVDPDTQDIVEA